MTEDLSGILDAWPYEPGKLNVRVITAADGEPRIQIRLDLGIIQMHVTGRPDGARPHGFESLLEYYEAEADRAEAERSDDAVEGESWRGGAWRLSPKDCQALREEAAQYHHRYLALLMLEDYEGVVRDTTRNLRVLDLCARYAQQESDRVALEAYRPYITMLRARALASLALEQNVPRAAVHAIDEGLEALRQYFAESGEPDLFEQSNEVRLLRGMREALVPKLPISQKAELRRRLQAALERENYELAAILRDELKQLPE